MKVIPKDWYRSKTVWFNVIFVIVYVAGFFGYADFKPDETTIKWLEFGQTVGNIVLRFVTTSPIKGTV